MSIRILDAKTWYAESIVHPLIDVRSPAEYAAGHIPGAINMPLFENEERARVGTLYKQTSRDAAMLEGLRIVGPKMADFVLQAAKLSPSGEIGVYCWRGGMRSGSVAKLFEMAGFNVHVIKGGYKGYRSHTMTLMAKPWMLQVITGSTGSGKTEILHALKQLGEQVLDLEGLAHHKGSAFGGLMQPNQPTSEHMQNLLADQLQRMDGNRRIWVEDESMNIGSVFLPDVFYHHLHQSPLFQVERSKEVRIERLAKEYGLADKALVIERIRKIQKKLGGQSTKEAIAYVEADDPMHATEILLRYYDKAYATGISDRKQYIQHTIRCTDQSAIELGKQLKELSQGI